MDQHTVLKNLHLDVSNPTLRNRPNKQITGREGWGYDSDFSIQASWVGKTHDTLKESMLAYSKKMSDIRRIRGINMLKSNQPNLRPPFFMHTSRGIQDLATMQEDYPKKSHPSYNQRSYRSLGTIKLEPLLGSQKIIPNLVDTVAIQVYRVNKHEGEEEDQNQTDRHEEMDEAEKNPVKQLRLTINMPPPAELQTDAEDEELSDQEEEEPEPVKKKLTPLGGNKERPRKAKRMKLAKPNLEAISEDNIKIEVKENTTPVDLRTGYANLLSEVSISHERMLEQKRQTIALLKQTNRMSRTKKQQSQSMLHSLVKQKLKKLPPIALGKPSLRYSTGEHGQSTLYSHVQV